MSLYVILVKFTEQGRRNLKPDLLQVRQIMQQAEQGGIKLHGWWMTMGPYDNVAVAEAPSDEAMAMAVLQQVMGGAVETLTLRAFTLEEVERMVRQLPDASAPAPQASA